MKPSISNQCTHETFFEKKDKSTRKKRRFVFFTFKGGHIFKTLALTFAVLVLTHLICCHTEE